ncbi:type VI secretion system protein TssL, short form [Pseudomonas sp. RGM2987]|uniref:type VI secretion system protein TssL, short form n=1 Tax=Pseudomonas sp. RGM2987 TaxID=2930090 RepID=UPI001FD6ACA8|nr:type VI secretion system protein TssL, short form [Pseudomonas sp. RGM2987]MCJ8207127.1 type VI secretion system protein TssL, short form [Pseudomonas sp. RGM2987]
MNRTNQKQSLIAADMDALLHDTYMLVVELRQGASTPQIQQLWQACVKQVEDTRRQLGQAGLDQSSIDHVSHAQCALLDETVLSCSTADIRAQWACEPLQAKFFNRHQAGIFLYEQMHEVLRAPAPDKRVLTVFQRVLLLGFRGRYPEAADPEREQILAALNAHVPPLVVDQQLVLQPARSTVIGGLFQRRSPLFHALMVALLLVGVWWAMDHLLHGVVTSLSPGEA